MQSDDDGTISAVNDSGIPVCLGSVQSNYSTTRKGSDATLKMNFAGRMLIGEDLRNLSWDLRPRFGVAVKVQKQTKLLHLALAVVSGQWH